MKLKIESVENGFIVTENSEDRIRRHVFHKNESDDSLETEINLLYFIASVLFESESKYSQHRLYINSFPGNSFEGELTEKQKNDYKYIKSICENINFIE